jgi:NDP-sugar pyrophosphorylase family protein
MEALILAGGKGERLGEAAEGRPKPLVLVAGRPLVVWTVERLARAGVTRVIVACAAGREQEFEHELSGLAVEVMAVGEPEPLGRGGGLRLAAEHRKGEGPVFALNGDELVDLDFRELLDHHRRADAAATIAVAQPRSPFGVVELAEDDAVTGFREGGTVPVWVSCGVYVLGEEALARLPEWGDHETTTFPDLAAARRLRAFRHRGLWMTVNTPKELRLADEYLRAHAEALEA